MNAEWEVANSILTQRLLDDNGHAIRITRWRIVNKGFMPIDVPDMPRKLPKMMTRSMGAVPVFESGTGRIVDHIREPEHITGTFEDGTTFEAYVVLEREPSA